MYDQLLFIQQQLKQRNVETALQQFYRLTLEVGVQYYQFYAYNQLLFLANPQQLPVGTLIHSDCRTRRIPVDINTLQGLEDYSGTISIQFPEPLTEEKTIEFIQIVIK
jgi:hypothetical protein